MQKAPPTPKGFRDITPNLAKKRRKVTNQIIEVLEEFGFEPIETPTIEFAQTLKGKYGEEERLIYEFKDRGGRDLALRYDLTVPLARYVATYNPQLPFRRWQMFLSLPFLLALETFLSFQAKQNLPRNDSDLRCCTAQQLKKLPLFF